MTNQGLGFLPLLLASFQRHSNCKRVQRVHASEVESSTGKHLILSDLHDKQACLCLVFGSGGAGSRLDGSASRDMVELADLFRGRFEGGGGRLLLGSTEDEGEWSDRSIEARQAASARAFIEEEVVPRGEKIRGEDPVESESVRK